MGNWNHSFSWIRYLVAKPGSSCSWLAVPFLVPLAAPIASFCASTTSFTSVWTRQLPRLSPRLSILRGPRTFRRLPVLPPSTAPFVGAVPAECRAPGCIPDVVVFEEEFLALRPLTGNLTPGGAPRGPINTSLSCRNLPRKRRWRYGIASSLLEILLLLPYRMGSSLSCWSRSSIASHFSNNRSNCQHPNPKVPTHKPPKNIFPEVPTLVATADADEGDAMMIYFVTRDNITNEQMMCRWNGFVQAV